MTKIRNTKKGMAKKTLSISLAVAMLATSNVPVWAAEDLFTDGSVVEFTAEAEAPVEVVEEAPVVEEEVALVADATTVSAKLNNDLGWGFYPEVKEFTATGLVDSDMFNVIWKVGNDIVEEYENVELSAFKADLTATTKNYSYIPKKEDCGKPLTLILTRPDSTDSKYFTCEVSTTVGRRNITGYVTLTMQSETPTYDGKEHNDASEWVSEAVFAGEELKYSKGQLNVVVNGTKGLVNTDSTVTISVTPEDTTYYTGEQIFDASGISKISWKNTDSTKNLKAEFVNSSFEYTGEMINLKPEDVKVTDVLSKTSFDSKKVIDEVWPNEPSVDAGTYIAAVSIKEDVLTNYSDRPTKEDALAVEGTWKIEKRNLANTKITLNAIQAQAGKEITDSQIKGAFDTNKVTDLKGKKITGLTTSDFDVKSFQENAGQPGYYTAKLVAKESSTNFTGETDVIFRVYNMSLNAEFDGDNKKYATAAEEYTGEAIYKNITKLGNFVLVGQTNPLTPGIDYDTNFVYANNTNAGTASFTVKGLNSYLGSEKTFDFTINAAKVTDNDITYNKKVVITGDSTQKPEDYDLGIVVKAKNGATPAKEFTLKEGTDYTVTYKYVDGNDDFDKADGENSVGNNYVAAEIKIINDNFKGGEDTFYVYSKISKKQVTGFSIATAQPSYVYTGEAIVPELIVKDGNIELEEGYDYKVKSIANGTNVGTAVITIAGMNEYDETSETTVTFEITPAKTSDLVVNVADQQYTGHKIKPAISGMKLGEVAIKDKFIVTYPDAKTANTEVGTGTLTITPDSSNKNFTGSQEVKFNIVGQKIVAAPNALKIYGADGKELTTLPDFQYDGKAHTFAKAEFVYWDNTNPAKPRLLVEGTDYEIKYFHNVYGTGDSRTAYVAVVGKGNYAGDGTSYVFNDENGKAVNAIVYKTFEITPMTLDVQNVSVSNGAYAEGMPVKPVVKVTYGRDSLTLVEDEDYELDYPAQTEPTTVAKYDLTVTGINGYTSNENLAAKKFKWGIDKKNLEDCDIEAFKDVTGLRVVVMNGSVRVPSAKYVVTENVDGTVTVTPAKDSKYYTGSKTVKVGGEDINAVPETPMITNVKVDGNKATVILSGESDGAIGYDYVIGARDCIETKDYVKVNKNKLTTNTTFTYTEQGTYYAYCHAWTRDENGKKVFSEWSNAYPFVVTAITPAKPAITSVKVKGNTVTVTYKKSANATGYDVVLGTELATISDEKRPVKYGELVKKNIKGNTVTATFKNVPAGTYYAGLHAFNRTSEDGKKVFSPWSDAETIKVK